MATSLAPVALIVRHAYRTGEGNDLRSADAVAAAINESLFREDDILLINMTTPRRTATQLATLAADPTWSVLAFRVTYHGSDLADEIIGTAEITYPADGPARLDSFLASCRLLWAGAQRRMFGQIQAVVLGRGVKGLTARWQPNGRNETYASWFAHQGWAEPVPDGSGWSFTGSTVTRDGESPDDLLTVMARYLVATHQPIAEAPVRSRLRDTDGASEVFIPGGPATLGLSTEDRAVVRSVFGLDPVGEEPRTVNLQPFWMDERLVNRDMFAAFLRASDPADQGAAIDVTGDHYVRGPVGDVRAAFGTRSVWEARLARQAVLSSLTSMVAVIDETVLRRPVGGPGVMAEQVARLADDTRAVVHVVPAPLAGYCSGLEGAFWLACLEDGTEVCLLEDLCGGRVSELPADIERARQAWEAVRSEALSRKQSAQMLRSRL